MNNIAELNMLAVQDAEVAAFLYKAYRTSDELTEIEQFRLERNIHDRFRHGDMAYFQFERGAIDEPRLLSVLAVIRLENPRVQMFWREVEQLYADSYRAYINELLDDLGTE